MSPALPRVIDTSTFRGELMSLLSARHNAERFTVCWDKNARQGGAKFRARHRAVVHRFQVHGDGRGDSRRNLGHVRCRHAMGPLQRKLPAPALPTATFGRERSIAASTSRHHTLSDTT
jgi:hypothetical protein